MDTYFGPDAELLAAWSKASYVDPAVMPMSPGDFGALQSRVLSKSTWSEVDEADRAWITAACQAVSAGEAPALTVGIGPENIVTDFAAEDAAAEAGLVPPVAIGETDAPLTDDDLDELRAYDDDVPDDGTTEGWVGV